MRGEEGTFEITRRLIEKGHRRIAFIGHATRNINAIRCPDQKLEWDAADLKIPNFPEAEKYLRRTYREGWKV